MIKGRHALIGLAAFFVSGCASISGYDPEALGQVVKITNRPQYLADLAECKTVAANYREPFSVGGVLSGAGTGAAQNAPAAVVGGPLVVAVGAAGGGTSAALSGLDLLDADKMLALGSCLREDSRDDHAFHYVGR